MRKKVKRDKLFRLWVEGDIIEFTPEMFKDTDKETAKKVMRLYWKDSKKQERETRCLNANGTRCMKNCSHCPKKREGLTLSVEQMREDGQLPMDSFLIEEYVEKKELHQALYAAINTLEEIDQQIILLIFGEKLSERETGKIVGLSQKGVYYRKDKAIRLLKESLKDFG